MVKKKVKKQPSYIISNGIRRVLSDEELRAANIAIEKIEQQKKDRIYQGGDRFKVGGGLYILAQVNVNLYCFVGLANGNRFNDPIKSTNSNRKFSKEDIDKMFVGNSNNDEDNYEWSFVEKGK